MNWHLRYKVYWKLRKLLLYCSDDWSERQLHNAKFLFKKRWLWQEPGNLVVFGAVHLLQRAKQFLQYFISFLSWKFELTIKLWDEGFRFWLWALSALQHFNKWNVVFRFKRPSYGEEFQANALFFETLNFFGVDNETQTEVDEWIV